MQSENYGKDKEKAYVLINCKMGKENAILSELRTLKAIKEAHGTFGAYDIIAEVLAEDIETLRKEITWNIRRIQAIRYTLTLTASNKQN